MQLCLHNYTTGKTDYYFACVTLDLSECSQAFVWEFNAPVLIYSCKYIAIIVRTPYIIIDDMQGLQCKIECQTLITITKECMGKNLHAWWNLHYMYYIAQHFQGRKTFTNFVILEPPVKVSPQNLGMLYTPMIGFSILWKLSPWNGQWNFLPIHENFLPRKFPAIG